MSVSRPRLVKEQVLMARKDLFWENVVSLPTVLFVASIGDFSEIYIMMTQSDHKICIPLFFLKDVLISEFSIR